MRVSPRTHGAPLAHVDTHDGDNMLLGRETVSVEVDVAHAVDIVLRPGEMSLHHVLTVHGSQANQSDLRRCGFAIRYISGRLKKTKPPRATATLVRGRDHGNFDLEEGPQATFHSADIARYNSILRIWMRGVFDEISSRGAAEH